MKVKSVRVSSAFAEQFTALPSEEAWFLRNGWQVVGKRTIVGIKAGDLLLVHVEGDSDDKTIGFLLSITGVELA